MFNSTAQLQWRWSGNREQSEELRPYSQGNPPQFIFRSFPDSEIPGSLEKANPVIRNFSDMDSSIGSTRSFTFHENIHVMRVVTCVHRASCLKINHLKIRPMAINDFTLHVLLVDYHTVVFDTTRVRRLK